MRVRFSSKPRIGPLTVAAVAALAMFAMIAAAPRAEAFIYWSAGAGTLVRATNDGTTVGSFISTPPYSDAVAIDRDHVYWTSRDGRIGRANLDGGAANPDFITGLGGFLLGLAVDGSHIYWSSIEHIGRANLDGSGVEPTFITVAPGRAVGLAVDGQHIYWGENAFGHIGRANLNGTGVEGSFIKAPGDPCSVVVDESHIYWSDAKGNKIGRASLSGSAVETEFIDPGLPVSCGVAVYNLRVYFGIDPYPEPASLARASVDGSGLEPFIALSGFGPPDDQIVVDALTPPPPAPPPGASPPSNAFRIVALTRNMRRGTARIQVRLPGAGTMALRGRGVRKAVRTVHTSRKIVLPVRPRRGLAKRLKRTGRARIVLSLRFTPRGGTPKTKRKRLKLVWKRRAGTRSR
jgi:hypothetical protein